MTNTKHQNLSANTLQSFHKQVGVIHSSTKEKVTINIIGKLLQQQNSFSTRMIGEDTCYYNRFACYTLVHPTTITTTYYIYNKKIREWIC